MRFLHTSDWHIGRSFHRTPTLEALDSVFEAMVAVACEHGVDVVVASGDIFDSSTPSAEAVRLLDSVLLRLSDAGIRVVLTAGNHDSPARLGAKAAFAHRAGIHVMTEIEGIADPITIADDHGEVHFYGVPYIEPALQRHIWTNAEAMRSQKDALGYALEIVRGDWRKRGGRAVVLAHTFAQGAEGESCDSERDIVGGVDKVPVDFFTEFTYAALGHIHGRAELAPNVRYSGAPLHYSFSEANKPRGGWLVDLDANGLACVDWVDFPVPRPLSTVTGTLAELLEDPAHAGLQEHWISATITDPVRPMNSLRRLQERFPYAVEITFKPSYVHDNGVKTYAERVRAKPDVEVIDAFLAVVRNGESATQEEAAIVREVVAGRGRE